MTPERLAVLSVMTAFPESARELVAVAGIEAAAALIDEWPGIEFPVPPVAGGGGSSGARHWARLAEVVGEAAAAVIVRHYAGEQLYIPSCKDVEAQWARAFARREYDRLVGRASGYTHNEAINEIALSARVTSRTVERWLTQSDF